MTWRMRGFALMCVVPALLVSSCSSGRADEAGSAGRPALAGIVRDPSLEVAGISLPTASPTPEPMAMKAKAGELLLVYFGYTSCPDVCPTTMTDISIALKDLPAKLAKRVNVAMVTVDPERDTAMVLTGYLAHFFDTGVGLRTDDPATLQQAATAFGVKYEVEQHTPGETYAVSHSAITYVVDDTGRVVVEWPFGFDSADMTSDITHLLTTTTS